MKRRTKKRCGILGCNYRVHCRWTPFYGQYWGIELCKTHFKRHNNPEHDFDLYDVLHIARMGSYVIRDSEHAFHRSKPMTFAEQKIISGGRRTEPHTLLKKGRRGREARRSLYTTWKDLKCTHPYRAVRWDVVYKVARCTHCSASVKRSKVHRNKYNIKKNQKNKPVLDVKYYDRKEITLGTAIMMFFFQNGIVDTTWEDAVKIARAVKPGTKFSAASFSWYRNHFIQRHMKRKETLVMAKKHKKNKGKKKVRHVPKKKKVVKKKAAAKRKKPTIQSIMFDYIDEVGVDEIKFERARKRVLKVHPTSAFKESHMGWYRSKWREINE